MRLLVLSPFAPRLDAPHGGGRSLAQLVVELGAKHRVALLCLRPERDSPADEAVRARCELVEEFPLRGASADSMRAGWRRRARLLYGLARGRPMWVADCAVRACAARVTELTRSWLPDVVQAEYHVMGQYLGAVGNDQVALVLTQHEPGAAVAAQLWRQRRGPVRLLLRADAFAWRRYERRVIGDADAVVTYTERDRDSLQVLTADTRIVRIPLGTAVPSRPAVGTAVEPESLLFVGNFMHPPNVDTARRLADEIFPRVLETVPGAHLYLVGASPPADLRAAAGASVTVTGYVDDVAPYLERAAVVVAPIRTGGGQRVKVLEALAVGKAIVASPLALEGMDVADGEEVLTAETDEEFAAAVVALLQDEQRRLALAAAARSWAERNLGWKPTVDGYEHLYAELLEDRVRRSQR